MEVLQEVRLDDTEARRVALSELSAVAHKIFMTFSLKSLACVRQMGSACDRNSSVVHLKIFVDRCPLPFPST